MKRIHWLIVFYCTSASALATESDSDRQSSMWLDDFRAGLTSSVDATAHWIDGFFAEERLYSRDSSYGRLSIAPQWSGYDGLEVKSRLRARVDLPHAEEQFSAFIGRVDGDEFLDDSSAGRPSIIRSPSSDQEWLVGLGFEPQMNEKHRLSYSVGIRGGLDFDTYVRARYRTDTVISDKALLRFQSSAFWRDSDGFGVAQRIDWEATLTETWLTRLSAIGTYAQQTNGLRWSSTWRGYKLYDDKKALAIETWIEGQTDYRVPINDYGVRVLHRQRYVRQWLFVETWLGYHWPRELLVERRQGHWMLGVEVELHFGTANAYLPESSSDAAHERSSSNGS